MWRAFHHIRSRVNQGRNNGFVAILFRLFADLTRQTPVGEPILKVSTRRYVEVVGVTGCGAEGQALALREESTVWSTLTGDGCRLGSAGGGRGLGGLDILSTHSRRRRTRSARGREWRESGMIRLACASQVCSEHWLLDQAKCNF